MYTHDAILSLALSVIFHLVDARIGPTDEGAKIMQKGERSWEASNSEIMPNT
jgi:hypothetical protein